jgi:hypothetical protein
MDVPRPTRRALDEQRVPGAGAHRDGLVHHPAPYAHMFALGTIGNVHDVARRRARRGEGRERPRDGYRERRRR